VLNADTMALVPNTPGAATRIKDLPPHAFWTREELIGTTPEEMQAMRFNSVTAARIAEINAAHAAALARLAEMPVEGRPS
jgi:hypothetical protein